MSSLNEQYQFREQMVEALALDLVGPGQGDKEVLDEAPLDRYIMGVLWPAAEAAQSEVADEPDDAGATETGATEDVPVAQARMRFPSSCGMTFSIDLSSSRSVTLSVKAARYEEIEGSPPTAPSVDEQISRRGSQSRSNRWQRIALTTDPIVQPLGTRAMLSYPIGVGLELYVYVREPRSNSVTVTAVLRNTQQAKKGDRDSKSWFQVEIDATTESPAFHDRAHRHEIGNDADLDSSALLYRSVPTFGIGHGCAVTWNSEAIASKMVSSLATTFIPSTEVPRANPAGAGTDANLRMNHLAEGESHAVLSSLRTLVEDYRAWIELRREELDDLPDDLVPVAKTHLLEAGRAADRVTAGIELLARDPHSMRAFRLANRAMMMQRARQDWIRDGAKGQVGTGGDQAWRPFQIAFILLNLPALAVGHHADRDSADILWFPTGGGKTEAYLGLIAFTILRRRLADSSSVGVAVIMRYTLRLLTIQQFERATMLMCSLESLRREESDLGGRAFSIGLWVGAGATPNSLDDARAALNKLARGQDLPEGNPMQLTVCPWCNAVLTPQHYTLPRMPERHLRIACGSASCSFSDGLPVHIVDEDVYRERPELLLGTVDKFAMMAWNENVGRLFGRDGRSSPPDLIIQDELHLISGPLGSVVGLYETAVDAACSRPTRSAASDTPRKPKIIASTATIRRAREQVRAIFDRSVTQFPPPGIDPDQSFFAAPANRNKQGTRQYIGVMAPGTSHATLLVRVYGALLQAAQDLPGDSDTRDPYWTLMGYFNSLRVLGGAFLQVVDDVDARLKVIAGRIGTKPRKVGEPSELTSRVPSSDIPVRLKNLEKKYGEKGADNVVLATNMISVGLDVDRLGLMAVMGQPQSSAEYIQATSRVGRKFPGLVVTILNAARSRDRSHYENFLPFHQSMYRSVEATSATPFAARARDRALHGALVSMARLLIPDLASDRSAHLIEDYEQDIRAIAAMIVQRAKASGEDEGTAKQLEDLIEVWMTAGHERPNMRYQNTTNPDAALLVDTAKALVAEDIEFGQEEVPWPTLRSMRDVDAESALYQIPARRKS